MVHLVHLHGSKGVDIGKSIKMIIEQRPLYLVPTVGQPIDYTNARRNKRKIFTDPKATKRTRDVDKPFPLPPATIQIQDPASVDCATSLLSCTPDPDEAYRPCFKCRQYNWKCTSFPNGLKVGDVEYDAGDYCVPSIDVDVNTLNEYTSELVLTTDQDGMHFVVQCKYPGIFTHSSNLANCSTFLNPCGPYDFINVDTGQVYDGSEPITFDPFYKGRCSIPAGAPHLPTWSDTTGPGIKLRLFYEQEQTNCRDYTNKTSIETLVASGYKRTLASQFATYVNTICLPTPCKYDPKTGEEVGGRFNSEIRACECPLGSSVPVIEDQDANGNAVDAAPNYPNACYAVPIYYNSSFPDSVTYFDYGNVEPNSTPHTYLVCRPSQPMLSLGFSPQNVLCVLVQRPALWNLYTSYIMRQPNWWGFHLLVASGDWYDAYAVGDGVYVSQNPIKLPYDIVLGMQAERFYRSYINTDEVANWRNVLNIMSSRGDGGFPNHNITDRPTGVTIYNPASAHDEEELAQYVLRRCVFVYMGGVTTSAGVYTKKAIIPNPLQWQDDIGGHKTNAVITSVNLNTKEIYCNNSWTNQNRQPNLTADRVDPNLLFDVPPIAPYSPW